ncbi:hypothetical protein B0H13DRAFT_2677180 [Mycena leptocephala]|nr:hypothetical protein B0H13DRAFT_2677180 [Mycena leptocephala]
MRGLVRRAYHPGSASSRTGDATLPIRTTIVPTHATTRYCNLRRGSRGEGLTGYALGAQRCSRTSGPAHPQDRYRPHAYPARDVSAESLPPINPVFAAAAADTGPYRRRLVYGNDLRTPLDIANASSRFVRCDARRSLREGRIWGVLGFCASSASLLCRRGRDKDLDSASWRIDGILQLTHARIIPSHLE